VPLLSERQARKQPRAADALLRDVVEAVPTTTIVEAPIAHPDLYVFGAHDLTDGSITLNIPLLRVFVALHELTHHVRPTWSERTVRTKSVQLLQMLDDDAVATFDEQLVRAIRATG
jgi:hypothetical protein